MAVVRCSKSHYYDNEKYKECPHCAGASGGGIEQESVTVALQSQQVDNYAVEYVKRTSPAANLQNAASGYDASRRGGDDERTVSIYEKKGVARFTAGWLVCVEGEEYGRDFTLYAGFNRIGRSAGNDIVLKDMQVSREEHCSIIYEEKKNIFYVMPKGGNLTYLDDEIISQAQEIKSGQIITVGDTSLEFMAFCTGEKRWEKKA